MNTKLTTSAQIEVLHTGDILKRFPSDTDSTPVEIFDTARKMEIDTFEIRSINPENKMIGLVAAGASRGAFCEPGDVARLFIKSYNLVAEQRWWVSGEA